MGLKVTFAVLNLCNIHNSGNIACFNYSVFTYGKRTQLVKIFFRLHPHKLYCQR